MMEIIEKCMRSSDLSGLHALQSMWDCSDSSTFISDRLLKSNKTLLMTASRLGHLECCKFLLSIRMPKIDSRNSLGFTALHYAAYHGHEDVVFLLLEASADPKLLNNLNESVLDSAVAGNHLKLVKRLEESRFLKKEIIFPGLFDFSGAFLSDLKERMESLPVNQAAIGAEVANPASSSTKIANCKSSKEPAVNNISSSNSSSNNSGSSSSSSNGHSRDDLKSAIETSPGDDCNLSDGEVEDDTTLTRSQDTNKVMGNHEGNLSKKRKNNTVKRSNADQHSTEDNNDVTEEYHEREVCGLTRYEASKYFIKVTSVLDGGQEELINTECALLCTIQSTTDKQLKSSNGGCVDTQKEKGKEKEKEKESNSVTDDFTIGRSRSNHCPLDDLSVSKSHAIISYYQGVGFILRDLKSKHGTFLDGVRLGISDPGSAVATVEVDKRGCDTSAVGGSGGNVKGGSNRGFLLQDGSVVQFGRVVCTVYKKRQSAVISSGPITFQSKSEKLNQAEESQDISGKKRSALMALYGHYEKPDKGEKVHGEAKKNVVVVKPPSALQTSMIQQHVDLQKKLQLHQQLQQQEDDQVMHVGATLLRKMGWEGTAIGRSGAPAAKPLTAVQRQDRVGLGSGIVDSQSVKISEGHCQHYAVDSKKSTMRNKMIARFQNIL